MTIYLSYTYAQDTSRDKSEAVFSNLADKSEIIIGRATHDEDEGVHIRLNFDNKVTRPRHARLYFDVSAWWVEDLNSSAGTFINEERVIPLKPVQLQSHDRIKIGNTLITVRLEGIPKTIHDVIETPSMGYITQPARSPSIITASKNNFYSPDRAKQIIRNVHKMSRFAQGQNLLGAIITELHEAFPIAKHLTLIRVENADRELVTREYYPDDNNGARYSMTLARQAVLTGDTQIWQRSKSPYQDATQYDVMHAVYVPITYMGQVCGVLHMNADTIISADDIALLEQLAVTFSSFIDNPKGTLQDVPTVFISYKSKQVDFVRQLEKDLRKRGICAWYDDRIRIGDRNWRTRLEKTIKEVDFFVIILSQLSVASEYVQWELQVAEDAKKDIFPVQIEECDVPSTINRIQRARVPMNPLDNWVQYEAEIQKLTTDIWDKKKGMSS